MAAKINPGNVSVFMNINYRLFGTIILKYLHVKIFCKKILDQKKFLAKTFFAEKPGFSVFIYCPRGLEAVML